MPPPDPTTCRLGRYTVTTTTAFGPRLLGISVDGMGDPFAVLGDEVAVPGPGGEPYRFRGGHRLWASPEIPDITYASDDHRCEVTASPDRLVVSAPPDGAGLAKRIEVSVDGAGLAVDHSIGNGGDRPVSVAPWAITQLALGGVALLPLGGVGDGPYQADRSLVLWPYTSLTDRRLGWLDRAVTVTADPGPRFKLGSGPRPGRLGYLLDGYLFTKEITPADGNAYPDRGAVGQVFVDADFCELESVGPLVTLDPGAATTHTERWELAPCPDLAEARNRLVGGPPSHRDEPSGEEP